MVDVLLTAGLIAGGSNGLAFLIQLLENRLAPPPADPQGEEPVSPLGASWYAHMRSTG